MEQLFNKNGIYSDIFKEIEDESVSTMKALQKNNAYSTELRAQGNQMFAKSEWLTAMEYYNDSLRVAEPGTGNVALAYANRAACFLQLKLFDKCLVDIEMAKQKQYPQQLLEKLEKRKANCMDRLKQEQQEHLLERSLSYTADIHFPCMADVLEIQRSTKFGRHVIAKCDLPAGKTILVEKSFLSAKVEGPLTGCTECQKSRMNFIACENCTNGMFCNEVCKDQCNLHRYDCNVVYHKDMEKNAELRMIAKSIYFAHDAFDSVDELMSFVADCEVIKTNWVPKSIGDSRSTYRLFLTLIGEVLCNSDKKRLLAKSKSLYLVLLNVPAIKNSFDTVQRKQFLQHLVTKHVYIISQNAIYSRHNRCQRIITLGLVFPLFNHACSPNLLNFAVANQQVCITMRPVKKGEQLFVSYICADVPTPMRKIHLLSTFGFLCECEKCTPTHLPSEVAALKADLSYQNLQRNLKPDFMNDRTRRFIKGKCIEILNKHGKSWSPELEFVIDLYINSEMFEH